MYQIKTREAEIASFKGEEIPFVGMALRRNHGNERRYSALHRMKVTMVFVNVHRKPTLKRDAQFYSEYPQD